MKNYSVDRVTLVCLMLAGMLVVGGLFLKIIFES